MNVILNPDSKTSKVYRWFYNKSYYNRPENLCLYFGSLAWMYITIIPYLILITPGFLFHMFRKSSDRLHDSFLSMVFLFAIFGFIRAPFKTTTHYDGLVIDDKNTFFQVVDFFGVLFWIALISVFTIFLIFKILKIFKTNEIIYIVVSFIKTKYNKVCPKITWKREG